MSRDGGCRGRVGAPGWRKGRDRQLQTRVGLAALVVLSIVAAPRAKAAVQEPPGESAPPQRPTFAARTELVRLRVAVFDHTGAAVTDLGAGQFVVEHDGEERPIEVFFPPGVAPLEVAVAMDVSGSMASWPSRQVFHSVLGQLPADACVLLLPFTERVGAGMWARADDPRLRALIDTIAQDGEAEAIYDALIAALSTLRARDGTRAAPGSPELLRYRSAYALEASMPPASGACAAPSVDRTVPTRRAVVVVSDQADSASRARRADVLLSAWGTGIPIYALAVTRIRRAGPRHGVVRTIGFGEDEDSYLEPLAQLARHSGGFVLTAARTGERFESLRRRGARLRKLTPIEGIERLGRVLGGHYLLGYAPPREAGAIAAPLEEPEITVRVDSDDLDVVTSTDWEPRELSAPGTALERVRSGIRALDDGSLDSARRAFEAALASDAELGLAHYGLALALAAGGREAEALGPLLRARERAPWLPDLDARIAAAALATVDVETAWRHALRAHDRGSDVGALIGELQRVAPREIDLARPPHEPRVAVRADDPTSTAAARVSHRFVAVLWNLASASEVMRGGWSPETSDLLLRVRILQAETGRRLRVRGELVLQDPGGRVWAEEPFQVGHADSLEATRQGLRRSFERIEAAVRALHPEGDPPGR